MNGNRKVWTGVLAGVLAAGVLLSVAGGAYRAGQRGDVVTRVVGSGSGSGSGDGDVVRVIESDRHGGPGFFLFPLLGIGLVVLLVSRGRHGGNGGGWCGPGPAPGAGWGPEARMTDWHQRAHQEASPATTSPGTGASAPSTPPTG